MQISGMNASIQYATNEYEAETQGISNAISKIEKLYAALNFEYSKELSLEELKEIVEVLLRPNLIINNSTLDFDTSEPIIIENTSDVIYAIIEVCDILTKNDRNDIKIKLTNEDNLIAIHAKANNIDKMDLSNLELLTNNIKIDNEQIIIKI